MEKIEENFKWDLGAIKYGIEVSNGILSEKLIKDHYPCQYYWNNNYFIQVIDTFPLSIVIRPKNAMTKLDLNEMELASVMNCFLAKQVTKPEIYPDFSFVQNSLKQFYTIKNDNNKIYLKCAQYTHDKKIKSFFSFCQLKRFIAKYDAENNKNIIEISDLHKGNKKISIQIDQILSIDSCFFYKEFEHDYFIVGSYISEINQNTYCIDSYFLNDFFDGGIQNSLIEQIRFIIQDDKDDQSIIKLRSFYYDFIIIKKGKGQVLKSSINFSLEHLICDQKTHIFGLKKVHWNKSDDHTTFLSYEETFFLYKNNTKKKNFNNKKNMTQEKEEKFEKNRESLAIIFTNQKTQQDLLSKRVQPLEREKKKEHTDLFLQFKNEKNNLITEFEQKLNSLSTKNKDLQDQLDNLNKKIKLAITCTTMSGIALLFFYVLWYFNI